MYLKLSLTRVNIPESDVGIVDAVAAEAVLQDLDVVRSGRDSNDAAVAVLRPVVGSGLLAAGRVVAAADSAPVCGDGKELTGLVFSYVRPISQAAF